MNTKLKVSFATKLMSYNHYQSEVAVEKKKCSRIYLRFYLHDLYTH